jgi:hypothetical protein
LAQNQDKIKASFQTAQHARLATKRGEQAQEIWVLIKAG